MASSASTPIAVIGLACRFPGAPDADAYWRLLENGAVAVTETPADRWELSALYDARVGVPGKVSTRWGGFIARHDHFDAEFFGINPREARAADPQQRAMLELAWHALEDAAIDPHSLAGTRTGVFVGVSTWDYNKIVNRDLAVLDGYIGPGSSLGIGPNRISYFLDLRGPSMAIDTACSSSLVALQLATQSLARGECDLALVGAVNLLLTPETTITFSAAGFMSPTGRCKTFSADADGYVRSEGAGMLVLRRLNDAVERCDRVAGVIRSVAVNQDGLSNGLTSPNVAAQQAVVREALAMAGVAAADVSYVETHGTGTPLGDPIEVRALVQTLCVDRSAEQTCILGGVKANIGHCEAAAGMAGLIKVLLSFEHGAIPPQPPIETINPLVAAALKSGPLQIAAEATPWIRGPKPRLAGVSAFGFGGTNAHAIVEEAPLAADQERRARPAPHLLKVTANHPRAVSELAIAYRDCVARIEGDALLTDFCHTANTCRSDLSQRVVVVGATASELCAQLDRISDAPVHASAVRSAFKQPRVAFLFPGQGSQYAGMAKQLYREEPVFRAAFAACSALADDDLPTPLSELLYGESAQRRVAGLDRTLVTQPALFAVEYALAQWVISLGLKPFAVVGHSLGEYVAACVAGVLSLADAMKLVLARARLMDGLQSRGAMAALSCGANEAEALLRGLAGEASIAAVNSPESCVISGEPSAVRRACEEAERSRIRVRMLQTAHAFHSSLMDPVLEPFRSVAREVDYRAPKLKLACNLDGRLAGLQTFGPDYFVSQLRCPVAFGAAISTLEAAGANIFLELGPRATLGALVRQNVPAAVCASTLRPETHDRTQVLWGLAEAYSAGAQLDWSALYAADGGERRRIPVYPFQGGRHWVEFTEQPTSMAPANVQRPVPISVEHLRRPDVYRTSWQAQPLAPADATAQGRWLVLADTTEPRVHALAEAVVHRLQAFGLAAEVGSSSMGHATGQADALAGIVDLQGMCGAPGTSATSWLSACQQRLTSALSTYQSSLERADWEHARVYAVTCAAHEIAPGEDIDCSQTSLWGLGRSAALELPPERWGGLIDIGDDDLRAPGACSEALVRELLAGDAERQVALRGRLRFVARLVRVDEVAHRPPPQISDAGSYLIVGGLGALGLQVAGALVERGAKHLVLTTRSAHDDQRPELTRLRREGAEVNVVVADVSCGALAEAVARCESLAPLRGVVLTAGTNADVTLGGLDEQAIHDVLAPKLLSAWTLHELTRDRRLDFFTLFSSVASLFGSPGQANYAAANAFCDGLAQHRHKLGLVATSIQWGPWDGAGLFARVDERNRARLTARGIRPLQPQCALDAFGRLVADGRAPQLAVVRVDWQPFIAALPVSQRSFYQHCVAAAAARTEPAPSSSAASLLETLQQRSPEARVDVLEAFLRSTLATALKKPEAQVARDADFAELGLDSLLSMEIVGKIRTALDFNLYPGELAAHPRVSSLARYLCDELFAALHPAEPASRAASRPVQPVSVGSSVSLRIPARKLPSAVFILSTPRAGSTLLRTMLAGHTRLFSPPELHLLPYADMAERAASLAGTHLDEGLCRAWMELSGADAAAAKGWLQQHVEGGTSVRDVYAELQARCGERTLIDKSPSYGLSADALARAELLFDGPRYIHLVRHPHCVIESFTRMRMHKLLGADTRESPVQLGQELWESINTNIERHLADIAGERKLRIAYEDLVAAPERILRPLVAHLGLDYQAALATPYAGQRMTDGVHAGSLGVGDPNFLTHREIDASLARRGRGLKLGRLSGNFVDLARSYGYDLGEPATGPSASTVARREHFYPVLGRKLCVSEWGPRDGAPVVLVHGILDQSLTWEPVARELAGAGHRVIAPDLRGHGLSDHAGSADGYTLTAYAADLVALLEQLGVERSILVGHSLGSIVAVLYALHHPDRLRGIALVETILPSGVDHLDLAAELRQDLSYLARGYRHPSMPSLDAAAALMRQVIPDLDREFAIRLCQRVTRVEPGGLFWRWDPSLRTRVGLRFPGTRAQYLDVLQRIEVPAALLFGTRSTFRRGTDTRVLTHAMPHARAERVDGGHYLAVTAPSAIVRCVLALSVDAPVRSGLRSHALGIDAERSINS